MATVEEVVASLPKLPKNLSSLEKTQAFVSISPLLIKALKNQTGSGMIKQKRRERRRTNRYSFRKK